MPWCIESGQGVEEQTIWIVRTGREALPAMRAKTLARKARFFPQSLKSIGSPARHKISNFKHQHLLPSTTITLNAFLKVFP